MNQRNSAVNTSSG